jgi:hypothetical protein
MERRWRREALLLGEQRRRLSAGKGRERGGRPGNIK